MVDTTRRARYFRIKSGRGNSHLSLCLNYSFIGVDFGVDVDLAPYLGRDKKHFCKEIMPVYRKLFPSKTPRTIGGALNTLWKVCKFYEIGDVVLTPTGKKTYAVGELTDSYQYESSQALPHRRAVKWYPHELSKNLMSRQLQSSMSAPGTVVSADHYFEELQQLLSKIIEPMPIQIEQRKLLGTVSFHGSTISTSSLESNQASTVLRVGVTFKNREEIGRNFGGHRQFGITSFRGEDIINVFSHIGGPYVNRYSPDSPIIEYQGQGLKSTQVMSGVNLKLDKERMNKRAVRFWTGPKGGPFVFQTWAVPLDISLIETVDQAGARSSRFVWFMYAVPDFNSHTWPTHLLTEINVSPLEFARPVSGDTYSLNWLSLYRERAKESATRVIRGPNLLTTMQRYTRNKKLRELVMARSGNACEGPYCTGSPPDVGPDGRPLLDVDHLVPLSEGGRDELSNMAVLCPNCHRAKTFGAKKHTAIKLLQEQINAKHNALLG